MGPGHSQLGQPDARGAHGALPGQRGLAPAGWRCSPASQGWPGVLAGFEREEGAARLRFARRCRHGVVASVSNGCDGPSRPGAASPWQAMKTERRRVSLDGTVQLSEQTGGPRRGWTRSSPPSTRCRSLSPKRPKTPSRQSVIAKMVCCRSGRATGRSASRSTDKTGHRHRMKLKQKEVTPWLILNSARSTRNSGRPSAIPRRSSRPGFRQTRRGQLPVRRRLPDGRHGPVRAAVP